MTMPLMWHFSNLPTIHKMPDPRGTQNLELSTELRCRQLQEPVRSTSFVVRPQPCGTSKARRHCERSIPTPSISQSRWHCQAGRSQRRYNGVALTETASLQHRQRCRVWHSAQGPYLRPYLRRHVQAKSHMRANAHCAKGFLLLQLCCMYRFSMYSWKGGAGVEVVVMCAAQRRSAERVFSGEHPLAPMR